MADIGVRFEVSTRKNKKDDASLPDGRRVAFGSSKHQQYRDTTPLKAYSHLDHGDLKRRENYFARHGRHAERYTAKWFSHKYLWSG